MAKRTITQLIDDIDNRTEAAQTVAFSVGDRKYEIDLNQQHLDEFNEALRPYIRAGRSKNRKPAARKPAA